MSRKRVIISIIIFTVIVAFLILFFYLNSSKKYEELSVTESTWNSIIAARKPSEKLVLRDIRFNEYSLVLDNKSSTLYYSLINDSYSKYNPSVSFKAEAENVQIAVLSDKITSEKTKNNHIFKLMIYSDTEYHIYDLLCMDLPILNINYVGDVREKKGIPVEIYLFNNLNNSTKRITRSSGKLRMNGDSISFSLNKRSPGRNIRDNKISILNMKPDSEYNLSIAGFSEEERGGQRVELFINNEYRGVWNLR
ncbi:MAG: hypothetical protein K6D97_05560 [Clostridia bacterium]|nr:hypothetical protein [Clostridia bacterium]